MMEHTSELFPTPGRVDSPPISRICAPASDTAKLLDGNRFTQHFGQTDEYNTKIPRSFWLFFTFQPETKVETRRFYQQVQAGHCNHLLRCLNLVDFKTTSRAQPACGHLSRQQLAESRNDLLRR